MRLDELVDKLVQPQQDQYVKIMVGGKLYDVNVVPTHESGHYILEPLDYT